MVAIVRLTLNEKTKSQKLKTLWKRYTIKKKTLFFTGNKKKTNGMFLYLYKPHQSNSCSIPILANTRLTYIQAHVTFSTLSPLPAFLQLSYCRPICKFFFFLFYTAFIYLPMEFEPLKSQSLLHFTTQHASLYIWNLKKNENEIHEDSKSFQC